MGISRIYYHRLLGSLGSASSLRKLLELGQLPNLKVMRLAFSPDQSVKQAAWKAINDRPQIIYTGAQRDTVGVLRLRSEAENVLKQQETEPRTVARALQYLISPARLDAEFDYLLGLLEDHSRTKQGEILSELGKLEPDLTKELSFKIMLKPKNRQKASQSIS